MTNRNPTTLNLCAQRKDSTGVANSCWISSGPPITTTRIGPEPRRQMGPCVVLISSSAMGGSLNNLRTRRTLSRFPGRGMGLTAMSDSIGICSAFQFQAGTNPACVEGPSVACSNHRHHDFDDDNRTEVRTRRRVIKGRGENQRRYIDAIGTYDINFGIGPAGTGKTYLAVACAVRALEADSVARILLVRPAVEAGKKLGFLPGDLAQKIDPYLRPLYDALYELFGFEKVHKLIERNVIEVAPLAYMRGRTLSDSFIILDESQNTTVEQMKMFLTRIGFGSTAVITGDVTQVDLPRGVRSGLKHVINVLDGVPGISFTHFSSKDVVRHPLVQRIVEAYERAELAEDARHEAGRESRAAARADSVRAEAARIDDAQPAAVQGANDAPSIQGAQGAPGT